MDRRTFLGFLPVATFFVGGLAKTKKIKANSYSAHDYITSLSGLLPLLEYAILNTKGKVTQGPIRLFCNGNLYGKILDEYWDMFDDDLCLYICGTKLDYINHCLKERHYRKLTFYISSAEDITFYEIKKRRGDEIFHKKDYYILERKITIPIEN